MVDYKHPNRDIMEISIGSKRPAVNTDPLLVPKLVSTNMEDKELADEILKFYKRLLFAAIDGENQFQVTLNSLLNSESIAKNNFGFVACLPSVYKRDYAKTQVEKKVKQADMEYLADIGETLLDLDCEVLAVQRSKNFDAFNVDAIINNKMVSWMSKHELKLGPAVIVKAKVKDHAKHWKHETPVTRLNYVKAAQ